MNRIEAQNRKRDYDKHRDSLVKLIKDNQCKFVAEIGVFESKTANRILSECHNQLEFYLMVDQFKEFSSPDIEKGSLEDGGYLRVNWDRLYQDALNTANKYKCAHLRRDSSVNVSNTILKNYFDLVFIDASHAYSDVIIDIESWFPVVRPGGIIAGHDYYNRWPGVIKAVDEFFPVEQLHFLPDTIWYLVKE